MSITLYWARIGREEIIKNPEPVFDYFIQNRVQVESRDTLFACPASNEFYRNLFVVRSNIDVNFPWTSEFLKKVGEDQKSDSVLFDKFTCARESILQNHINLAYSARWIMYADKPLTVQITAPFAPSFSPIKNAIFTNGEYDVGRWFRPGQMEFFVPIESNGFYIKENDPLFYIRAKTEEEVVFKNFKMNRSLSDFSRHFTGSVEKHGRNMKLEDRYKILEKEDWSKRIIEEINNNLL